MHLLMEIYHHRYKTGIHILIIPYTSRCVHIFHKYVSRDMSICTV